MGWFDLENAETKMNNALKDFSVHTSDITVRREILESKFVLSVGINTYDVMTNLIDECKEEDFNGIVGLRMAQGAGLGGAAGVILYGTAVRFE